MTKRSPIVDPEEPEGHTWTGQPILDASKITANSLPGHRILSRHEQRLRDATEYVKKRYGTMNPPSGATGLFQPIECTREKDADS